MPACCRHGVFRHPRFVFLNGPCHRYWPMKSIRAICEILCSILGQPGVIQQALSQRACLGEADQHDVPWVGDLVAQQHTGDPPPHVPQGSPVIRDLVLNPHEPEPAATLTYDDAALHQLGDEQRVQRLVVPGEHPDPVGDGPGFPLLHDARQQVRLRVSRARRGVEDEEVLGVGVDAVLQGQIHQQCPADGVPAGMRRQPGVVPPGVVVQHQQQHLFADGDHARVLGSVRGWLPAGVTTFPPGS